MTLTKIAPAKVNLFLHIVGRRADGYHLLESLVAFADFGDEVSITPALKTSLTIAGPFATPALHEGNSVLKALSVIQEALGQADAFAITLAKNLPVAAGIGGGSADAAAVMHLLNDYYGGLLDASELEKLGLKIGADVPVCLRGTAHWMGGIGEELTPCLKLDTFYVLLVNNRMPLSTPAVFKTFKELNSAFEPKLPAFPPAWVEKWDAFLQDECSNSLTTAACALDPSIADLIARIHSQEGCVLGRMSGSGGTCFGLFKTRKDLEAAAKDVSQQWPEYWIEVGKVS